MTPRKHATLGSLVAALFACGPPPPAATVPSATPGARAVEARASEPATSPRVEALLARMTPEEKLGQLTQYAGAWDAPGNELKPEHLQAIRDGRVGSFLSVFGAEVTREAQRMAVEESRLGIPLIFAFDVIHGFRTTFPVPLAEASSFHADAVERAARVAAIEATAVGIHWTFAPMVDVARDPRWGRIVEGSGEDPYLGSLMAAARVRGFQGDDLSREDTLLACAKHFAAYGGAEGGRDYNTVDISWRTLEEVYLPPFRSAIDAGVTTFMTAFNEIGGVPASAHRVLLRDVLRERWGFDGVVVSDWESIEELMDHGVAGTRTEAGLLALNAGVDVDMVSGIYATDLPELLRDGRLSASQVDDAVRRVLVLKERLGLFDDPYRYSDPERERTLVLADAHREAARAMARESMVLLRNEEHTLPLSKSVRSLAVLGPLAADTSAPLGPWSTPGRPEDVVSVLEGIRRALPDARILHEAGVAADGGDTARIGAAVSAARRADAVILVLGEPREMSGEARNRASIDLPGHQLELARAVIATGKPVVVVLLNGRPLAIPWLADNAPALLEAWYLGVETGNALADVLFGDFAPVGRLPVTFPRATGQVPIYYNHKNTGRPGDPDVEWTSKYVDVDFTPLYAFGHGLGYTTFEYRDLALDAETIARDGTLQVSFVVENTGERAGTEVAQLYVRDPVASVTRPVLELRGFSRVELAPGEEARVVIPLRARDLAFFGEDGAFVVEPGAIQVLVGASSRDIRLRGGFEILP